MCRSLKSRRSVKRPLGFEWAFRMSRKSPWLCVKPGIRSAKAGSDSNCCRSYLKIRSAAEEEKGASAESRTGINWRKEDKRCHNLIISHAERSRNMQFAMQGNACQTLPLHFFILSNGRQRGARVGIQLRAPRRQHTVHGPAGWLHDEQDLPQGSGSCAPEFPRLLRACRSYVRANRGQITAESNARGIWRS